jgi:hypothetical protein
LASGKSPLNLKNIAQAKPVTQMSEAGSLESSCINMNVFWSLDGPFEGAWLFANSFFAQADLFYLQIPGAARESTSGKMTVWGRQRWRSLKF